MAHHMILSGCIPKGTWGRNEILMYKCSPKPARPETRNNGFCDLGEIAPFFFKPFTPLAGLALVWLGLAGPGWALGWLGLAWAG